MFQVHSLASFMQIAIIIMTTIFGIAACLICFLFHQFYLFIVASLCLLWIDFQ